MSLISTEPLGRIDLLMPVTPEGLARELIAQHRIVQKALPVMVERALADPDLRDALLAKLLEQQCRRELEAQLQARHQAEKKRGGGGPIGAQRSSDVTDWAGAVASSLLDEFKLPNGKKLGDASRTDLETAMAAYDIQAADAAVKHRWFRLIQQSLPAGKRVRNHLTDARLQELRDEARKQDA